MQECLLPVRRFPPFSPERIVSVIDFLLISGRLQWPRSRRSRIGQGRGLGGRKIRRGLSMSFGIAQLVL